MYAYRFLENTTFDCSANIMLNGVARLIFTLFRILCQCCYYRCWLGSVVSFGITMRVLTLFSFLYQHKDDRHCNTWHWSPIIMLNVIPRLTFTVFKSCVGFRTVHIVRLGIGHPALCQVASKDVSVAYLYCCVSVEAFDGGVCKSVILSSSINFNCPQDVFLRCP